MIILHSYIYYITPQDALCEKIFLCRHTSIFLLPESTKLGFSCLMSTMGESLIVIHYKFRIWIYVTFHSFATNPKILLQPKSFSCCIRHAFEKYDGDMRWTRRAMLLFHILFKNRNNYLLTGVTHAGIIRTQWAAWKSINPLHIISYFLIFWFYLNISVIYVYIRDAACRIGRLWLRL